MGKRKPLDQWTDADWLRAYAQNGTAHTVSWRGANFRGADLRWADLRGIDLCGADLQETDLRWANLQGVNLSQARLYGANLYGASGIMTVTSIGPQDDTAYFVQDIQIMVRVGKFWGTTAQWLQSNHDINHYAVYHAAVTLAEAALAEDKP